MDGFNKFFIIPTFNTRHNEKAWKQGKKANGK